jgi:hypothetical protein
MEKVGGGDCRSLCVRVGKLVLLQRVKHVCLIVNDPKMQPRATSKTAGVVGPVLGALLNLDVLVLGTTSREPCAHILDCPSQDSSVLGLAGFPSILF